MYRCLRLEDTQIIYNRKHNFLVEAAMMEIVAIRNLLHTYLEAFDKSHVKI